MVDQVVVSRRAKEMTGLTNFDEIDLRNKFIKKYPNSATAKEEKAFEKGKSDERRRILNIINDCTNCFCCLKCKKKVQMGIKQKIEEKK